MNPTPFRYFAIIGSMRSGSNLLEQSLNQFPDIKCFGELFNPAFIGGPNGREDFGFSLAEREKDPVGLLAAMVAGQGDGIVGFRIFDGHDERVLNHILRDRSCAKILLKRDFLESYISLKIARQTDQWLLRNASHRKTAKVDFDAAEFSAFTREKRRYFSHVRQTLQDTGQTAFEITYPDQKATGVLNGIATFLGASGRLKTVKETILRQNPEPLSEKVNNYIELQKHTGYISADVAGHRGASDPRHRANIPKMVSCLSHPVLFAPVPGGPNDEVLRWMAALDQSPDPTGTYSRATQAGEILHTGHSQRTLFEWMAANPGLVTLTAVRHPVLRAYDVFMRKIFATGNGTYDVIRKQLVDHFDLILPDSAAEDFGIKQHRAAFHGFLRFLRLNLQGQTSIRTDGLWATQTSFITGFNTAVPVSQVLHEGQMDAAFRYLESRLDLPEPALARPILPQYEFPLKAIYTRQTENLARKAYGIDYIRLGFGDYQAALDV